MLLCSLTAKDLLRICRSPYEHPGFAHMGSYIFYEDLYRSNRITTYVVPFVIGMLLAQDSIVGISIPSSISLPASLFTRSVIHHLATNSLVPMLARLK